MELRHLRYFIVLAEELHFGRAAERLGITQPPLSQQIQALERGLEVCLFERTNRRVALTDAGRLFLTEAYAAVEQAERAATVAKRAHRGEIGEIRIGLTASAPFIPGIPKALFAFRQAFPSVHMVLEEMKSMQQIAALVEHRLHAGFIRSPHFPPVPDSAAAKELFREPLVAVLSSGHPLATAEGAEPITLASLATESFIFFPRTIGTGLYDQMVSLCREAGFIPRIDQEARDASTIIGLVAAGLGVSLLPASFSRIRIDGVVCRTLTDRDATAAAWLVYRAQDNSPLCRALVDIATSCRHSP
jgi:DNA-binding transcriptional LysR family regulator